MKPMNQKEWRLLFRSLYFFFICCHWE